MQYQDRGYYSFIDLSAIIRSQASVAATLSKNFNDFAAVNLAHINDYRSKSGRIDIVADLYYELSIKRPTRMDRELSGARLFV